MLEVSQLRHHVLALADDDDTVKRQALQALRLPDEKEWATLPAEATHSLVEALKAQLLKGTKQPFPQKDLVTILGNLGSLSKSAVPQLIELLQKGVSDLVREAAATALGKIGKEAKSATDQLVDVLANARPALTSQAVRALGNIGHADSKVRSVLVNLWVPTPQLQSGTAQVAIALCKLHVAAPNLLETLARTLVTNQDVTLRKAAAEALAHCGKNDPDVVPALLASSLTDTNEEVRLMAQAALDQMRLSHEKAIDLCAKQLGVSVYAEAALRKSGPSAVAPLIKALGTDDAVIQVQAARTLGCLGEEAAAAAPGLIKVLHDKNLEVRLAAAKSLWNITKTADHVVPALVDLLKVKWTADPDDGETRRRFLQTVMETLSRIGPPATAAVTVLTALAKDPNRHIKESAQLTLQKITPTAASSAPVRR